MPLLYSVQNSCIAIILILVILNYVLGQKGRRQAQDSLFVSLIVTSLVLLILEMLISVFSGRYFSGSRTFLMALILGFYLLIPLPGALYFLYIDQMHNHWQKTPRRMGRSTFIPILVNAVCVLINLSNGMMFAIDATNTYHRGPYYFIAGICSLVYVLGAQTHLVLQRGVIKKENIASILAFPYPVLIGAGLQMYLPGIQIFGISLALTILLSFLQIQNIHANKDYLTSLYNRSLGQQYLQYLYQHKRKGRLICGILMDIDGFKAINDTYGHDLGDSALRLLANVMRESFGREWLICRYGGDEFFLFRKMDDPDLLEDAIVRFKKKLDQFNTSGKLPFVLSVSMGRGLDEPGSGCDVACFLKLLDEHMYLLKKVHYQDVGKSSETSDHS